MMIDVLNMFSDGQAITASAASENVLDFGENGENCGEGTAVYLNIVVTEDFACGVAASLQVDLEDSADNAAYNDVLSSADIDKADLVKGKEILRVPLPDGLRRYGRIYCNVTGGPFTAGKLSAFLTYA